MSQGTAISSTNLHEMSPFKIFALSLSIKCFNGWQIFCVDSRSEMLSHTRAEACGWWLNFDALDFGLRSEDPHGEKSVVQSAHRRFMTLQGLEYPRMEVFSVVKVRLNVFLLLDRLLVLYWSCKQQWTDLIARAVMNMASVKHWTNNSENQIQESNHRSFNSKMLKWKLWPSPG